MNSAIKRRDFLRRSMLTGLAAGAGMTVAPLRALAACDVVDMPKTLVNLMFYGGMDSRFVFMPAPNHYDGVYLAELWAARSNLYTGAYPDYASMFLAEYDEVTDPISGSFQFGIHKSCGWLKSEFDQGRVAVIANSVCSKNRRHDQSQLNANLGEPAFNALYYNRSGWGGRLVEQLSSANTIEISHEISVFGNGSLEGERLKNVIHAKKMRDIALPNVNTGISLTDRRNVLTRALKSYYEARGAELANDTGSPFNLFFQHNNAFRAFGDAVEDRLNSCGPLPPELANLDLNSGHFEQQCRNLYDVCLAPDILNVGTLSMRYDGWDTHNNEYGRITNNLSDVFGSAGGLATAMGQIAGIPTLGAPANEQLTFCTTSDFGRQLKVNGDRGTDHGRGIYTIVAGYAVNGGVYGEMFPAREAIADSNGKVPFQTSGADIQGLTSTERVLAEACEWMQPGSSAGVFPNASSSDIEMPGMLDTLFS